MGTVNANFIPATPGLTLGRVDQEWKAILTTNSMAGGQQIVTFTTVPPTATSPGVAGSIAFGGGFLYICVADDTWQRVAILPEFSGADMAAKIQAAIAALPSGGTVDAREFHGAQSISSDPFSGATQPVTLLLGEVAISSSVNWVIPGNTTIKGEGYGRTSIHFAPATPTDQAIAVVNDAANVEISDLGISGTANTGRLFHSGRSSNLRIHGVKFSGCTGTPSVGPNSALFISGSSDVWITDCTFTGNGRSPVGDDSDDLQVSGSETSYRVHVRGNSFFGSNTSVNISVYNAKDSDVIGNVIDQNNIARISGIAGGYGIVVYSALAAPDNVHNISISDNQVQNTAGAAIYLNDVIGAVVSGNSLYNTCQQEDDVSLPVGAIATADATNCVISGNRIDTSAKDGIALQADFSSVVVQGNSIAVIAKYGINIRGTGTNGPVIQGNSIWNPVAEAIYVGPTSTLINATIQGNICKGCLRNGIAVGGTATDCSISGNEVWLAADGFAAITLAAGDLNVVAGNILRSSNASNTGIDWTGTDSLLYGNLIHNINKAINSTGATNLFFGNKFVTCPTTSVYSGTDVIQF